MWVPLFLILGCILVKYNDSGSTPIVFFHNYPFFYILTLFGMGLKIYVKWRGVSLQLLLNTQNHCEKPKICFCFSDRSYRNRKSHEIWGHLEAILRVLELIFGRGLKSLIGLKVHLLGP